MVQVTTDVAVMTVDGVAAYLRLPQDLIIKEAERGVLPGRRIGDTWRFLKSAIDGWLRTQDGRAVLLQQAGALAADESLPALLDSIYAARQRPEREHDE